MRFCKYRTDLGHEDMNDDARDTFSPHNLWAGLAVPFAQHVASIVAVAPLIVLPNGTNRSRSLAADSCLLLPR